MSQPSSSTTNIMPAPSTFDEPNLDNPHYPPPTSTLPDEELGMRDLNRITRVSLKTFFPQVVRRLRANEKQIRQLNIFVEDLKTDNRNLHKKNDELKREVEDLKEENRDLKEQIRKLDKKNDLLEKKNEALEKRNEALEKSNTKLQDSFDELEKRLTRRFDDLAKENRGLRRRLRQEGHSDSPALSERASSPPPSPQPGPSGSHVESRPASVAAPASTHSGVSGSGSGYGYDGSSLSQEYSSSSQAHSQDEPLPSRSTTDVRLSSATFGGSPSNPFASTRSLSRD